MTNENAPEKKAIIYCRVSSQKQKKEGHGLDAQEHRCRQHAVSKGYKVLGVFKDDITGGTDDRPGMERAKKFLEENAINEKITVIVDDIKRWARDVTVHFALRAAIESRNGVLESPNFNFGDSPEDKFYETIMAASAALEKDQNQRQVKQKMKARLEKGYWTFDCPPGYRYEKKPDHGKILVPDEPMASIIREGLKQFHDGLLETPADFARYLYSNGFMHRKKAKKEYVQQAMRILTRILYAGWVEYGAWGVKRKKGHHEGLISIEMFDAIQERLRKPQSGFSRRDVNEDFPLRGFILCCGCNEPLTASWSKGRTKQYAYYRCDTRGCLLCGKSISAEDIETDFWKLITDIKPKPQILDLAKAIVLNVWKEEVERVSQRRLLKESRMKELDSSIEDCCEKIEKTDSDTVMERLSKRVEAMEAERRTIKASLATKPTAGIDYETATNVVFEFVQNPVRLWESESIFERRLVPKFVFTQCLVYKKGFGYGTPDFSLLFELSSVSGKGKSQVVEMPGIEPGSNV